MIVKIEPSSLATKRYTATMDTGKKINFGFKADGKTGYTYIDGAGVIARENYRKRHLANSTEKTLINNLVPSASLFAYYLLWGPYTALRQNLKHLNKLWKDKHLG